MSDTPMINDAQAGQKTVVYSARPWVRHYEQGVSPELTIPDQPLIWLLDQAVPTYSGREIQHQLAVSGARIMVMLDSFYPVVRAVRASTALEHVSLTSPADFLPPLLHILYPLSQRGAKNPQPLLTSKDML